MPDGEASSNGGGSTAGAGNGGSNNTSSDFVRKLYKMLEEPQYANIVRWGNDGKSFVVLENSKFTNHILPKHFKHSNFASFVRQLNKYDFHKVRQNDENGQSPYGPNASEFVHPGFRADCKDNLDNIRRKAPAPRRQQPTEEQFPMTQQMIETFTGELRRTRADMRSMQEEHPKMIQLLADQVGRLLKIVTRQSQALDSLVTWHTQELRLPEPEGQNMCQQGLPQHLRQTREIVDGLFADLANDVEKLNPLYDKFLPTTEDEPSNDPNSAIANIYGIAAGTNTFDARGMNPRAKPEKQKDIWDSQKPCILLVEDEQIAAKIAQKRLQSVSCQYEYARNGRDAVAMVNRDPAKFDLILMDIKLPDIGGIHATALIRMESHPRMPIIAMTASRRPDDLTTYLKHGMDDLLPKPFSGQVFEAILRKHLPHLLARDKNPNPVDKKKVGTNKFLERPLPSGTIAVNTNLHNKFEQTPIQSPAGSLNWVPSPATTNQIQSASPVPNGLLPGSNGGAVMHPGGISNGMPAAMSGLGNGMGGGMGNGMGNMTSGGTMSNGVLNAMDPTMTTLGPSSYMAAMTNSHMGIPPMSRHYPAMNSGYSQMGDNGLDFSDERPDKRQRLYGTPNDMGYQP